MSLSNLERAAIQKIVIKLGEQPTNGKLLQGSGETVLIQYPQFVVKVFRNNIDIEVNVLRSINSNNIIRMFAFSHDPNIIVYERITPLKKIVNPSEDQLKQLLCNVAGGLYDLHKAGYTHGDVAIGNIGIRKGIYILYDLETAKPSSPEGMYRDVEMFLEDLQIQYKNYPDLLHIISERLSELRKHRVETLVPRKTFSGKIKMTKSYTYNYKPEDFGRELLDYCEVR